MSDRVHIEPTKFVNARDGEKTYGVRVYDDYAQTYDNTWDNIPKDDMEILKKVSEESRDNVVCDLLESVVENKSGIYIGQNWYEWKEIKKIL